MMQALSARRFVEKCVFSMFARCDSSIVGASQVTYMSAACRSLWEETERLRQENTVLEEELQDVNAEIMSVQEDAFTNEEVLLQRIHFLGQELDAHEADSSETIAQLDCELRSVALTLERVTVERDNLSEALIDAAR